MFFHFIMKIKKIVFINANSRKSEDWSGSSFFSGMRTGPHFPLGVVSIASYLSRRLPQADIHILDEQILSAAKIKRELFRIKPDIVGVSCVFKNYSNTLDCARNAKKIGAKVILGGCYVTVLAQEVMNNRGPDSKDYCVDAVIRQDGEEAFFRYVKEEDLWKIDNLVFQHNDKTVVNKIKVVDLNSLPPLDFTIVDPQVYFHEYQRRFPTSKYKRPFLSCFQKGCAWRERSGGCIFCSLMDKKLRLKNPREAWREIDELVSNYGVDYIWDVSDSLLSDKKWFEEFYHESQRRLKKPFLKIQARVDDLVEENTVRMLADMNVVQIFIGFESADDQCLMRIKKGTTAQLNQKVIFLLAKYGIFARAFFVLGLPGESSATLSKTVRLAEKIVSAGNNNLIIVPVFTPLPGSLSFHLLKQKTGKKYEGKDLINWDEANFDWNKYFCRVSFDKIQKTRKYLSQFPCDITTYSY